MLLQIVFDDLIKKKFGVNSLFSILMAVMAIAQFLSANKLLHPIVLLSGIILIVIRVKKNLPIESLLKLLIVFYSVHTFTTVINLIKS